jgi:ribosomal protein L16/L10AE
MKYKCPNCNFLTSKKSHYTKHLQTLKHKYNVLLKNIGNYTIEIDSLKEENEQIKLDSTDTISKLTKQVEELNTENKLILKQALSSTSTALESSNSALNKSLNNSSDNNKTVDKSLSVMKYLMTNCMDAPDIDKLDVKNSLKLTTAQYKAITHNPLRMADVILEKYYKDKTAKEISLYCSDASRKKFIIKENGKWVKDPGGEKLKKFIIIPIARKTYAFNEDYFNNLVDQAGEGGRLTHTQLKIRETNLVNLCSMEKDVTQNIIIRKLTGCSLKI